ncbi:MAG: TetR/AcrR family transcriptional regulator [Salinisphaeraceae bacterium]|nr:TetR/AcrR family transcriptional regulator [Salinisphaeraceae bacterium]
MPSQAPKQSVDSRGRPPKEGLRDHLLMHTLQVLIRDGYDRFSMVAVAKSARASKETLYRYFCDKAGLLAAAMSYLGQMVEPIVISGLHDDLSREARLQQLAENYLQGCLLPESLTLQRIAYASGDTDLGQMFAQQFTQAVHRLLTQEMSMLSTPNPELDAEVFLGMVQGQLHEKALLGTAVQKDAAACKKVTEHAVRIFTAYLDSSA